MNKNEPSHDILVFIRLSSNEGSGEYGEMCQFAEAIAACIHKVRMLMKTQPGIEIIKLGYSLSLKIKRNDWPLADTCPQAANHCALF